VATTLRLGPQPDDLVVDLYAGCDWWTELELTEADGTTPDPFDPTESLTLRLAGTDFPATIVTNTARWDLTAAEVDALFVTQAIDAAVLLVDTSGPDPVIVPWWVGVIVRHS
jgi:hypothetical protein